MWTRKRTVIGGQVCEDDWCIYWDGRSVGRVFKYYLTNPLREVWSWSKLYGRQAGGYVATLEEGLETLRETILKMEAEEAAKRSSGG